MRTVSIKLKDMAIANIQLGFVGENNATQVIFECKEIFDENPYAVQLLVVTPPEGTSYEVTTARIGDNVIWNVSELDTAFEGDGSIQLVFTDGSQVIKTYNADTTVLESQVPSGTAPATALNWIQDAEAWAKGTRGGRAVEDDDPTYQNNSKYYSDKIVNMASDSEAWAKGTRDGEAVESDDPAYQNNSKYYAESIADTASDSEAYAAGTRGGEAVDEDDPAYHNNAAYYNEQAALEKAAAQAAAETASAAYNVNLLADNYDATKLYAVGEYCIYNGGYKRCIVPITTAEAWTSAHWADVTVGKDLSALKSAITENKTYADWESGGLNPANGGNTTNAARIRLTKYVGINNNIPYALALTGYEFSIFAWNNSTGTYVGMYTTGNVFATSGTAKWVGSFDFAAYPGYKFRVVLRNAVTTTASISTSEATNCVFTVNRFDTDETLTKEHVAADAKKTGEMKSAIKTIDGVDILSFESGGMYQETGIDYNDATKSKTKFVKVNPGSFIRFLFDSNISSSIAVYEFASNDETTVSVNNRLAVRGPGNGVTIQLSSSTNYIRVQVNVATSAITSPFLLLQSGTVFQIKGTLPNNTSFNSVIGENSVYIISSTNTYTDVPESYPYGGLLIVCHPSATITNHIFINNNPNGSNWQRYYSSGSETWGNWKKSDGVVNNYTFPTYEYTYNVSASPEITTDTNNYLASTGDTTDRATDIQTLLNTTGYCHLGPGDFYITGVAMPSASCIEGCGNKTRVFLKSSVTDGFAFKLPTYGTIKNMRIIGSTGTHTPSSTVGTRHGILFEGDASAVSPSNIPYRGIISDVMISDFNGGGITLYNTGLAPSASVSVTNAYIVRCDAGIYIPYYSEFSRFTNVSCGECYYGCVNNGGNNYFANCSFSKNTLGLLMDNSESQSPNCGHGAFVACNFHHSNNNNGTAIRVLNIPHGELFNGCQIGYGSVDVEDCKRIVFSGCSFLASVPISIEDSIATLFGTCTFVDGSTITVTNSATTHFDNCYDDTGTAVNPMS